MPVSYSGSSDTPEGAGFAFSMKWSKLHCIWNWKRVLSIVIFWSRSTGVQCSQKCLGLDSRKNGSNNNSERVKISRSMWVSIAPLTAKEIRHLQVPENLRLHLSTSVDAFGAKISVKINYGRQENGTKPCFGYPWYHSVYNLGFHSLLKYVNVTLPHSSEECSPQSSSVSFPKVDSNSGQLGEPVQLLRASPLPFRQQRSCNTDLNANCQGEENRVTGWFSSPTRHTSPPHQAFQL